MKTILRESVFAFLAWLIPFVISVCLFSLKQSRPALFDTLMGVVVATSTAILGVFYMRKVQSHQIATGVRIGVIWMVANWMLDGLMFSGGPMKLSFDEYVMDIGLAYLAIPAVTIGLGIVASNESSRRD